MSGSVTAVTLAQFRADRTEFADPSVYPDGIITSYLTAANAALPPWKWGNLWVMGVELWVAHFLAMDQLDARAAQRGDVPGRNLGVLASKSVGPASASFDAGSSAEERGGMWNLTTYGRRWLTLARMVGAGPVQASPTAPMPGNWFPGSVYGPLGGEII